jgi:hypothetical protein
MRSALPTILMMLAAALPATAQDNAKANTLSPKEVADGWILLFDGATTFGCKADGNVQISEGQLIIGGNKPATVTSTTAFGDYDLVFEYYQEGKGGFLPGWKAAKRASLQNFKLYGDWLRVVLHVRGSEERDSMEYAAINGGGKGGSGMPAAGRQPWGASRIVLATEADCKATVRNVKLRPLDVKAIFNGKDLTGWHVFPGRKSQFTVEDGAIVCNNGPGDLQTDGKYGDFILQLECKSNGEYLNSGIFFRCKANEYQNGYEAQIHNKFTADPPKTYNVEEYDPQTHKLLDKKKVQSAAVDYGTGAVYRRVPARKSVAKDGEWFTMTIVAQGNHIATWVNGIQQVDWHDNRPPSDNPRTGYRREAGHISIQGHDPTTNLSFRNIRIAELPSPGN